MRTLNGKALVLDLDTPDAHQTGSVSGTSMSGLAAWRTVDPSANTVVNITGNWSAAKQ